MDYFEIKKAFEEGANEKDAQAMAAYMKNNFTFYGLKTPKRKVIYKDFLKEEKKKKKIDWDLLDRAWEDPHREFQYFVIDYLKAMEKYLVFEDLEKMKGYIQSRQWWDSVDGFHRLVGNLYFLDHSLNDLMLAWSKDEDFWLRRLAIIHQLSRKEKTNPDLLEKIIINNLGSDEFFINKAIGWALREYSKTDGPWVREFLKTYGDKMGKLSLREASKYL